MQVRSIRLLTQSLRSDGFDTLQHSCVLSTPQHLPVAYPIKGSTFLLKSNINTWLLTCALLVFLKDEGEGCTKSFLPILSILAFSTCIHLKCYASWFCWSLQCKSPVVRQDSSIRRSVESFYIIYQTRWHQQLLSDVQHNHVIHLLTLGTISDERYEGLEMSYQCPWRNNFFGSFLIYQLACSGLWLIFNLWVKKNRQGFVARRLCPRAGNRVYTVFALKGIPALSPSFRSSETITASDSKGIVKSLRSDKCLCNISKS